MESHSRTDHFPEEQGRWILLGRDYNNFNPFLLTFDATMNEQENEKRRNEGLVVTYCSNIEYFPHKSLQSDFCHEFHVYHLD